LFLVIAEFILLPPPPEAKRSGADDSQSGFRAFATIVVSPGARGILLEIGPVHVDGLFHFATAAGKSGTVVVSAANS
jgi:hypothetical protein